MQENQEREEMQEFSLKSLFIPFTTSKAIHWIVVVGFIVYGNMLFNDFVWDDKTYIINYIPIHNVDILFAFGKNVYNIGGHYRPIPELYFSILYSLFTTNSFPYHILQLLLHSTNTIFIFLFIKKIFTKPIAFFLSLIFLIHPLQVESVSYIGSSNNPLFFLFGICALILSDKVQLHWKRLAAIAILLLLSVLTKETGILFFIIIPLWRLLRYKKVPYALLLMQIVSLFGYFLLRFPVLGMHYSQTAISPIAGISLGERLIHIPAVLAYYISNFFFPDKLAVSQLWVIKTFTFQTLFLPFFIVFTFFLLIIGIGLKIFIKKKHVIPIYIFFTLWTVIGLGMYSQIVPLDSTVADRWFYFPIVGILGLFGLTISLLLRVKIKRKIIILLGVIIILSLSLRTIIRNTNWQNAIILYEHDRALTQSHDLELNLGTEYYAIGQYSRALMHFKKSQELFSYEVNTYNICVTYGMLKNVPASKRCYLELLHQPHYYFPEYKQVAYENLGKIESFQESPDRESLRFIREGVKLYPNSGYLLASLAYSEYVLGNDNEALRAAKKAHDILQSSQTRYMYERILHKQQIIFE